MDQCTSTEHSNGTIKAIYDFSYIDDDEVKFLDRLKECR